MIENIDSLIASVMKTKDQSKLKVLRLIKAEFQKVLTSGKDVIFDEAAQIKILLKLQKQWKEELDMFKQANRKEADDLDKELKYLESFLPREMSEEEQIDVSKKIIEAYLKGLPVESRASMKHLGVIMGVINKEFPTINKKIVSDTYKKLLGI